MGALTSNRKRGDDCYRSFASSSYPIDQSYGHTTKKSKHSSSMNHSTPGNTRPASLNSVAPRILQYPEIKAGFSREVHAPVKNSKYRRFSFHKSTEASASSRKSPAEKMGMYSFLRRWIGYEEAKDSAMRTLRYAKNQKGKQVIEVDSEDENQDGVSDDSSIEEVEIVDSEGDKLKGGQGVVDNSLEFNCRTEETEVKSLGSSEVTDYTNAFEKVDDVGKTRLSLLDQVPDDYGVPQYVQLYDSVKIGDGKLAYIDFDIELAEKRLKGLHLFRPQKKEVLMKNDVAKECFDPLTEDEKNAVSRALSHINRREILVTHQNSNIEISGEKLQCLRPKGWLNDEVINLYLQLLKERERREPKKFLKCHFFNTFFYKKLISGRGGYNFDSVQRWTTQKKLGYSLLECDKIFVPIHRGNHWCLAVINKKDERFQYLDSLGGFDNQVLNVLASYFVDEVKDKCGKEIDVSLWTKEFVKELPEQENGYDCGVFMIKYADFYSRGIGLCFSQEDVLYFRLRTAKEILQLRAE